MEEILEILENDATFLSGAPIDQGHSPTPIELRNILRFSDLETLTKYFDQFYPKRDESTQKFITHLLLNRVIELLQREQISPESAANYILTNFQS
jgi:hypothetical protein